MTVLGPQTQPKVLVLELVLPKAEPKITLNAGFEGHRLILLVLQTLNLVQILELWLFIESQRFQLLVLKPFVYFLLSGAHRSTCIIRFVLTSENLQRKV